MGPVAGVTKEGLTSLLLSRCEEIETAINAGYGKTALVALANFIWEWVEETGG